MGRIEAADAREVEKPFLLSENGKAIFYIDHFSVYDDTVRVVSEFRQSDGTTLRTTEWLQYDDSLEWKEYD